MMRINTLFTACFYLAIAHLPVHAMDQELDLVDATDDSIENNYKNHPDYVFATHFLQFIGKKINEGEHTSITLEAKGVAYMLHYIRAVEGDESYGLKADSLTEWLIQLSQKKIDTTTTEHIKKRIHQILNREPFTKEQVRNILIAFLDSYDDNFKALDYQQKISVSLRSLVLRLMEICNAPASISQRLGMALEGSRYPQPLNKTIVTEISALLVTYVIGFMIAVPTSFYSASSFGALAGYPVIGAFAGTGLYNAIKWCWLKREENTLRNAMSTAPMIHKNNDEDVLLKADDE